MAVRHFSGLNVQEPSKVGSGSPLWPHSAYMPPGNYTFAGESYDCSKSGRYVFQNGFSIAIRLVFANDLYGLMSGISWNHAHGVDDEHLTDMQAFSNAGMTHKWRARCGIIAAHAVWLLPQLGFQARRVQALTLGPLNGFDDGHIMPEVFHDGKWKLWDLTNGCYWTNANGAHLSLAEIVAAGSANCQRVQIDAADKAGTDLAGGFCMATYREVAFRTEPERDAWFARIFQSWSVL